MAYRRTIVWGVIVGSALAMAGQEQARGAEWSVEPSMSARGEYHSNILLTFVPQQSTFGYWISPAVRFAGATESLHVSSRLAADYIQYYGGKDTTIYNLHFPLSVQYRDQRSVWGFEGGLLRDNTLRSELQETGVVLAFAQRNLWSAAPSWTYSLSERVLAQSSYQYQHALYDSGGLRFGFADYQVHTASETLSYKAGEKDAVQLAGLFTRFMAPERNDMVSDTFGVQIGGTHEFSESLTLSASGGPRFITNRISVGPLSLADRRTVWVFSGKLARRFEQASLSLDIGRDIYPSGFGLLIERDHLSATARYELTDHLAVTVSGQASVVNPVPSASLVFQLRETRFFYLAPEFNWRVNEYWSLEAGYAYSRRETEGSESGESHAVRFTVTYVPQKISISH